MQRVVAILLASAGLSIGAVAQEGAFSRRLEARIRNRCGAGAIHVPRLALLPDNQPKSSGQMPVVSL